MYSCAPQTSDTTRITGTFDLPAGIARYATIAPSLVGTLTSPAERPSAGVLIVCADTGSTAAAKPAESEVTTNVRRSGT